MQNIVIGLAFVFFLAGCSNATSKQAFNRAANTHIQSISVAHPPDVKEVNVVILSHPGSSFGLIGGLIAAADTSSKTGRYNKKIAGQINWNQYTMQQITSELSKVGYKLTTAKIRGKKQQRKDFLKKYPEIPSDAILDYYFAVGQIASGATTNYVPTVKLKARLTDLKNKTIIYEQQFSAGLPTRQNEVNFPPVTEYSNINTLVENSGQSVESLKKGIQQIAKKLARDLAK